MKKILLVLSLITVLISCKSTKPSCDAYGKINHDKNTLNNDSVSEHLKSRQGVL